MQVSSSLIIHKRIEDIFAYIQNVNHLDKWITGLSQPKQTSKGKQKVGTTISSKYTYNGVTYDVDYVIIQYQPPYRYAIQSISGPHPFKGYMTLERLRKGTKITSSIDAKSSNQLQKLISGVSKPFFKRIIAKQLQKDLKRLKAELDAFNS